MASSASFTDADSLFTVGSLITVIPLLGEKITGEVIGFDHRAKVLVLKQGASSKKNSQCNIVMCYVGNVKNLKVDRETPGPFPPDIPNISYASLKKRHEKAVRERMEIKEAMNSGAPEDARQIFLRLSNINLEPKWGPNFSIRLNCVTIESPYKRENVIFNKPDGENEVSNAKNYVQKQEQNKH